MPLFVFQFDPVCKFGKFINFGLGTVRSERVKLHFNTNNNFIMGRLGLRLNIFAIVILPFVCSNLRLVFSLL